MRVMGSLQSEKPDLPAGNWRAQVAPPTWKPAATGTLTPVTMLRAFMVCAPFGFLQHLPAMSLQALSSLFEHLSASPVADSFQPMPFLFQRFAPPKLGSRNLFLAFGASLESFRRRITGSSDQ